MGRQDAGLRGARVSATKRESVITKWIREEQGIARDMYEALKALAEAFDDRASELNELDRENLERARTAIARYEGKA